MLNEGVFRSPEWLIKYVDFELHTGLDIKGKKSRKQIEKERVEATRKLEDEKRNRERNAEIEEERRNREVKIELDNLFSRMVKDFSNNPYKDKYKTPIENGVVSFTYTFEQGDTIKIINNKITYNKGVYTVSDLYKYKFIRLANEIMEKGRVRNKANNRDNEDATNANSRNNSFGNKSKNPNHIKSGLYKTLKDTVKQREDQLKKLSRNDPERVALENELNSAKRKVSEMNSKYKFEKFNNIQSFTLFTESDISFTI